MSEMKRQLTDAISLKDVRNTSFLRGFLVGLELGQLAEKSKKFARKKQHGDKKTA